MFKPYRKLAKLSLNLDKLSCINWRCIKFASISAIESESSAKAGSNDSNGKLEEAPSAEYPWLSLREVRELGRKGVVGREGGLLRDMDTDLLALLLSIVRLPKTNGDISYGSQGGQVQDVYMNRDS